MREIIRAEPNDLCLARKKKLGRQETGGGELNQPGSTEMEREAGEGFKEWDLRKYLLPVSLFFFTINTSIQTFMGF